MEVGEEAGDKIQLGREDIWTIVTIKERNLWMTASRVPRPDRNT